jgi:hypothetical protein
MTKWTYIVFWKIPRLRPVGKHSFKVKTSVCHWWNDTDRENPKYFGKNLSLCHFVQYKFPKIELGWNPILGG